MMDIELTFAKGIRVSKMYPVHLPDLFKGSSITLLGRYKGDGDADVVLSGKIKNRKKTIKFQAENGFISANDKDSEKNDFIPSLWAARRVGYLLDQVRLHGADKELVEEITQLARAYGIITPYTSYLIVEDERANVRRRRIREEDQTLGYIARKQREHLEREYKGLDMKSGAPSVQASKEVQGLNSASNYAQTRQGGGRLNYRDKEGSLRNLTQQVKNIQGRAVYNIGKFWVDSFIQSQKLQKQTTQKVNRIQFASDEYFELLKKEPLSAQFLALGQNIRFVLKNEVYEIHE
jgi:Ca-activated chloride channel family protein